MGNTNLLWVVNMSKAGFARRKKVYNSQPIGTIWCAVCELGKGGMFKLKTLKLQLTKNRIIHGIVLALR